MRTETGREEENMGYLGEEIKKLGFGLMRLPMNGIGSMWSRRKRW